MINVFGYIRVSGKGQLEGDGIDRQRATIEAYCRSKGFRVLRWFIDGAVSGTVDVEDRPQFAEMLLLAGPATAQIVVIERADRLARQLTVSELACEEARKSGIQLLEAASDTDLTNSDDPTRVLIRQVLGSLAEWNKNVIVQRLRSARARKRGMGKRCEGSKPFGHEQRVDQLETLSLIVTLRDVSHFSFRDIASELNRRGRPTAKEGENMCWNPGTVKKIYEREAEARGRVGRSPLPELTDGLTI
jgi:DNA invertase Pin-like site-specific DNA recombinase